MSKDILITFDEICESQVIEHDQEFLFKEDHDSIIEILEQRLKEAENTLRFYADKDSWDLNSHASASTVISSKDWQPSREIGLIAKGYSIGGKTARAYFEKHNKKE